MELTPDAAIVDGAAPLGRRRTNTRDRLLALLALVACLAPLAVASGSEAWLGLVPCAFCLLERRPYEAGAALALVAFVLPARIVLWGVFAMLLVAIGLSAAHVGVEQHWWPDPLPACSAPAFSGMTMAERLSAMPSRPAKPCEDPDFLIPGVRISMAQMGLTYAAVAAAAMALTMSRTRKINRPER